MNKFAKIDNASIYLDEFLLFVGDNNSGKTLLMELLYGVSRFNKKVESRMYKCKADRKRRHKIHPV